MTENKIDELVRQVVIGESPERIEAGKKLALDASAEATTALILLLESSNGKVRNTSALALREIGDNSAVRPLLAAIKKPDNRDDRSTLVYALETLDCSRHFLEIFELALEPREAVQWSAVQILHEGFYTNNDEIEQAASMLENAPVEDSYRTQLLSLLDDLRTDEET